MLGFFPAVFFFLLAKTGPEAATARIVGCANSDVLYTASSDELDVASAVYKCLYQ